MIIILSPAKTLDFTPVSQLIEPTQPQFTKQADGLIKLLRKYSPAELSQLMGISRDLAELNAHRFAEWHLPFTATNAKPALLAFKGEVYRGLEANTFTEAELLRAHQQVRILSGLYGILRPLDLIQPYRLEMGIPLPNKKGPNLYQFWGDTLTHQLELDLKTHQYKILINLASVEYFKALNTKTFKHRIITPLFYQLKNGKPEQTAIYAKKARGLMTAFIIKHGIENPEELKAFDSEGYYFDAHLSKPDVWSFVR